MADTALTELAARLQVSPPALDPLAGCRPDDLAGLADAVSAMLASEDEQVDAGIRAALATVPLPLRGRARSLLLGDDA